MVYKSLSIFLIIVFILSIYGCSRNSSDVCSELNSIDHFELSLLWKDLNSNSRECLHRSTNYLSNNRDKMSQSTVALPDDGMVYVSNGESLSILKERSEDFQCWLKKQNPEDVIGIIDGYLEYLEGYSPYYIE